MSQRLKIKEIEERMNIILGEKQKLVSDLQMIKNADGASVDKLNSDLLVSTWVICFGKFEQNLSRFGLVPSFAQNVVKISRYRKVLYHSDVS